MENRAGDRYAQLDLIAAMVKRAKVEISQRLNLMDKNVGNTTSREPLVLLDGTRLQVEDFNKPGRLGNRALIEYQDRWLPAEIIMTAESTEIEAICKNASAADGPHSGALLSSIRYGGWTADGYFVQIFDEAPSCRPLAADDFKNAVHCAQFIPFNLILLELIESLRHLHSLGFVHAAIHPGSLITADNRYSINEFWYVHQIGGGAFYPPLHDFFPGCLGADAMLFCAPELYLGASPSIVSDIYSLGSSLLYLLTGQNHIMRDTERDYRDVLSELIEAKCAWLDEQSRGALALMLLDNAEHRSNIAFLIDLLSPQTIPTL